MFKHTERTPVASPSMTGAARGSLNFGYMNTPMGNQLTPTLPQELSRPSRRSFTPNFRDINSPTISPINNRPDNFDMDIGWQNSNTYRDMINGMKGFDDEYDGMARRANAFNARMRSMDRVPTFLSPATFDAYSTPNFSPRNSNLKTNCGAISKNSSFLVNSDGNVDKSLAKRALMLTPKTSRFSGASSSNNRMNELLFDTSPPPSLNLSLDSMRDMRSTLPPIPTTPMPSTPLPASARSPRASADYNVLNERMDIASMLTEIGMSKYLGKFIQEEIDLFAFFLLNVQDLMELNIPKDDQRIILEAVKVYSEVFNVTHSFRHD